MQEKNELLQQQLAEKEQAQKSAEGKRRRLEEFICVSSRIKATSTPNVFESKRKRRETWCPGSGKAGISRKTKMNDIGGSIELFASAKKTRGHNSLSCVKETGGKINAIHLMYRFI